MRTNSEEIGAASLPPHDAGVYYSRDPVATASLSHVQHHMQWFEGHRLSTRHRHTLGRFIYPMEMLPRSQAGRRRKIKSILRWMTPSSSAAKLDTGRLSKTLNQQAPQDLCQDGWGGIAEAVGLSKGYRVLLNLLHSMFNLRELMAPSTPTARAHFESDRAPRNPLASS